MDTSDTDRGRVFLVFFEGNEEVDWRFFFDFETEEPMVMEMSPRCVCC